MRTSYQAAVAFFMLITFVTGMAFSSLNPGWLAHELDHDRVALAATYDHSHDHPLNADAKIGGEEQPFSDAEHKLLHALSHCAQAPCTWHTTSAELADGMAPLPIVAAIATANSEPLFRPPRSTRLL